MEDRFGHRISYLRVSVTDRCNERCVYCMPQELQEWLPRNEILRYEEIARLVRVASTLGVTSSPAAFLSAATGSLVWLAYASST